MPGFHGEPTRSLENQFVQLEILENSARIVRFSLKGRSNLFADLGSSSIETPYGNFYLRGGHRLWHAPEMKPRTYIPDNEGALEMLEGSTNAKRIIHCHHRTRPFRCCEDHWES